MTKLHTKIVSAFLLLSIILGFFILPAPASFATSEIRTTPTSDSIPTTDTAFAMNSANLQESDTLIPSNETNSTESQDPTPIDPQSDAYIPTELHEKSDIFIEDDITDLPYSPGEILVVKKENVPVHQIENTLLTLAMDVEEQPTENVFLVEIPEDQTVQEAVQEAADQPDVLFAQPNYIYFLAENDFTPQTAPNDPRLTGQWAYNKLEISKAWNIPVKGGSSSPVLVAILDTGVDMEHEDLQKNLDKNRCYDLQTKKKISASGPGRGDDDGHGTLVAGIIAATVNNGLGVAGFSDDVKIFSVDIFKKDEDGVYANTSDLLEGLQYAVSQGASVINMSLASTFSNGEKDFVDEDLLISQEITRHQDTVISVAAGGNGSNDQKEDAFIFPADIDACISVTAINENLSYASNYNYSPLKDIAAPGINIWSTSPQDQYKSSSGTSMAAPIVSAVAATLQARAPWLTVPQIKDILFSTATDLGPSGKDNYYGYGLVNPVEAIEQLRAQEIKITGPANVEEGENIRLSATVLPDTAGDKSVQWSVENKTGKASITQDGLLTAVSTGSVIVYCKADDGRISASREIKILNFSIFLFPSDSHIFPFQTIDYSPVSALSINVKNTGDSPTGTLQLSLTGANKESFVLSSGGIPGVAAETINAFTVKPRETLLPGEYTATVNVAGKEHDLSASFFRRVSGKKETSKLYDTG